MFLLSVLALSVSGPLLWWSVWGQRSRGVTARALLLNVTRPAQTSEAPGRREAQSLARRLTHPRLAAALESRALAAGLSGADTVDRLLAAKWAAAVLGVFLGYLRITSDPGALSSMSILVLPVLGYFGFDVFLDARGRRRKRTIEVALADTLDQITVSVEAGLGFEAAMARTSRSSHGPLSEELQRTLQDIQAGMSRSEAMRQLADRADVDELRHFVLAMLQAERYGVPVAQVLRIQSQELRIKRRQKAEERAMKLPVKLIFPLIFCILPALFIVLLGPGILRFSRSVLAG